MYRILSPIRNILKSVCKCILSGALVVSFVPGLAYAAEGGTLAPDYTWYSAGESSLTISSPSQFIALANIVNGTVDLDGDGVFDQDSFKGKTIALSANLNLQNSSIQPIGDEGHSFDGAFDGNGRTVDNFSIVGNAQRFSYLGLFGHAGEGSSISNVIIGAQSSVSVALGAQDAGSAIEYVGGLVGYSAGSISNVITNADVSVSHEMNQTKQNVFPIRGVGGIAGACLGDISNCKATSDASLIASEPGKPYKPAANEDWDEQGVLVICIGGIVGIAGAEDSSLMQVLDGAAGKETKGVTYPTMHGIISNCANASEVLADAPAENGLDRFGNTVYAQACDVGGIAGYSRGSVLNCTNSGYLHGAHAKSIAGIVGNMRSKTESTSYNGNFTSEGSDDGVAAGEGDALVVKDCFNTGDIYGYAFSAGIVGRSGTYVDISGCVNGNANRAPLIVGTRATKPFPSGIVGSTNGIVSYCANYGNVYSGQWKTEPVTAGQRSHSNIQLKGGYFASGVAGNLVYFTKKDADGNQERYTPMPEVVACLSVGNVNATDGMRQRSLVGDNAGNVHNCIAQSGIVYEDMLVYGMYPGDNESSGGTWSSLYTVDEEEIKGNAEVSNVSYGDDGEKTYVPTGLTVAGVLNAQAPSADFAYFWLFDEGENDGYPMLNTQANLDPADITAAQVSLAKNAPYNGGASQPLASVELSGKKLVQNVDFRVVVASDATAMNTESETAAPQNPYVATIQGIGNYTGTAAATLEYGICRGDLAACTVAIDTKGFNWEPQVLAAGNVHVKDSAGNAIDSSEYTFAFDEADEDLTDGKAINVAHYTVKLTASTKQGSHFTGETTGEFTIKTAKIGTDTDADKQAQLAQPMGVSYLGEEYEWESQTHLVSIQGAEPKMSVSYTGKSIKPTVTAVTFKGRNLELGKDYRVVYGGDSSMEGATDDAPNVGKRGEKAYGYVNCRYIAGGNFSNYDIMKFVIDDRPVSEGGRHETAHDISKATFEGLDDIIFEPGSPYEPVKVLYGGSELTLGEDYTITYQNNAAVGKASFIVRGINDYSGTKSETFNLIEGEPYELSFEFIDGDDKEDASLLEFVESDQVESGQVEAEAVDGSQADSVVALTEQASAHTAIVTGVEYRGVRDSFALTIPRTVTKDGVAYTVTEIADKAFGGASAFELTASMKKISKVVIPSSVERIGKYAFAGASNASWNKLESVVFDDIQNSQLKVIGEYAFRGCGNLKEFVFPSFVESIGNYAFHTGSTTKESSIKRFAFMTKDSTLPSSISTKMTFSGIGLCGTKIKVYGYDSATKVKDFAAANASSTTNGTHAGRNFSFGDIEEYFRIVEEEQNSSDSDTGGGSVTPTPKPSDATPTTLPKQVLKASNVTKKYKSKKGKLAYKKTFYVKKVCKVSRLGTSKITYKLTFVSKKVKKYVKLSSTTGKVTVSKGLKRGKYTIKVKVHVAKGKYQSAYKTVRITLKIT